MAEINTDEARTLIAESVRRAGLAAATAADHPAVRSIKVLPPAIRDSLLIHGALAYLIGQGLLVRGPGFRDEWVPLETAEPFWTDFLAAVVDAHVTHDQIRTELTQP